MLFGIWTVGRNSVPVSYLTNKMRSYTHTIICQGTESRHHLQGCNANFLANGYGTNRRRLPTTEWPNQASSLAGQFNSGARAEPKAGDEVIHRWIANA